MKVTGPSGSRSATPARGAAPASSGGGFAVGQASAGAAAGPAVSAGSLSGVAGVSALMALQGVETALERRRRAVRRGGGLLDRLDELKVALLSGQPGAIALAGLRHGLDDACPEVEDDGLTSLLRQIDLRAAVELAKAERGRTGPQQPAIG